MRLSISSALLASLLVVPVLLACETKTGRRHLQAGAASISGSLRQSNGSTIAGARVTLVDGSGTVIERRTDSTGRYRFEALTPGAFTLGASSPGRKYREATVSLTGGDASFDDVLPAEDETGRWETIGDPGDRFGGTNSGVLLPDGRLMYCHDTLDPVILDPVSLVKTFPPESPRLQGCHAVTVMPDGRVIYVGGADMAVYGPGTRQVKTFNPTSMSWTVHPDLTDYRWYPSMISLADGELLAIGGGGLMNPTRVKTSEIMSPATMTWTRVGDVDRGNEVSPIALLYTGEVLMTFRPPQLYNPATRAWRLAADFVQGSRNPDGDHADHEIVVLPDGRVVAIGYKTYTAGVFGNLTEIYDPVANRWSLGASFAPVRSRASILLLPDRTVLVIGGKKEETTDPTPVNAWGQVKLTDLYDPAQNSWRRLADLAIAREYHAMPILVPDGRVFVVGGEGEPGNEPATSTVEAFSPPYLFRGPRPVIAALSSTTFRRGERFTFDIGNTATPTKVVLMSAIATTHFMDSGTNRYLDLPFTQSGTTVTATVPADPNRSVVGHYILFAMVDDIPSVGKMVRIVLGAPPAVDGGASVDASTGDATGDAADGGRDAAGAADRSDAPGTGLDASIDSRATDAAAEALDAQTSMDGAPADSARTDTSVADVASSDGAPDAAPGDGLGDARSGQPDVEDAAPDRAGQGERAGDSGGGCGCGVARGASTHRGGALLSLAALGILAVGSRIRKCSRRRPLVECMGTHPLLDGGTRLCAPGHCYCPSNDTCFAAGVATTCCSVAPTCAS